MTLTGGGVDYVEFRHQIASFPYVPSTTRYRWRYDRWYVVSGNFNAEINLKKK